MAVFKKSRYSTGLNIYYDKVNDTPYLDFPNTSYEPTDKDFIYQVRAGESAEFLACQFYGDPTLKWIILYANPQYFSELDIKAGDSINIIAKERVNEYVNGFKQ